MPDTAPTVVVFSDEASMSPSGGKGKDPGLNACFRSPQQSFAFAVVAVLCSKA